VTATTQARIDFGSSRWTLGQAADIALPWDGVSIQVDTPRPSEWYSPQGTCRGEKVQLVHVISRHARGEICGYFVVSGALRRRLPWYQGDWPEMDLAVSTALGLEVLR
jgi:hypothetical protein